MPVHAKDRIGCRLPPGHGGVYCHNRFLIQPATQVAVIAEPEAGAVYHGGDSIAYAGSATDPEDGAIPASRLTWWAELHHDTHTHPFLPRTTGASGKVYVPPIGETSDNVFLRFYLEAADADGLMDTVSTDVLPVKVEFTLATVPAGLALTLDGQPQVTPVTITGVVGMQRELGATSPQTISGTAYQFTSWSDRGDAVHDIITPATATTYTARFTAVANRLPTVSLSAGGSTFTVHTAVTLTATASDPDGTLSKVGFYDGTTLLGEDTATPYVWNWTPDDHRIAFAHGQGHGQPRWRHHQRHGSSDDQSVTQCPSYRDADGPLIPDRGRGGEPDGDRCGCRRQRGQGGLLRREHAAGRGHVVALQLRLDAVDERVTHAECAGHGQSRRRGHLDRDRHRECTTERVDHRAGGRDNDRSGLRPCRSRRMPPTPTAPLRTCASSTAPR